MNFKLKHLLIIMVIIFGLFAVYAAYSFVPLYKHTQEIEDVVFYSNIDEPINYLKALSSNNAFIISTSVYEDERVGTREMGDAMIFLTSIFSSHSKEVTSVIKYYSENNTLSNCYVLRKNGESDATHEKINSIRCEQLLYKADQNYLIEVLFPEQSRPKAMIVVEKSQVKLYPSTLASVSHSTFILSQTIYEDINASVNNTNNTLGNMANANK